jgi:hypothetical protein
MLNNFEKQEIDGSGSIRVYVSFVVKGTAA